MNEEEDELESIGLRPFHAICSSVAEVYQRASSFSFPPVASATILQNYKSETKSSRQINHERTSVAAAFSFQLVHLL